MCYTKNNLFSQQMLKMILSNKQIVLKMILSNITFFFTMFQVKKLIFNPNHLIKNY